MVKPHEGDFDHELKSARCSPLFQGATTQDDNSLEEQCKQFMQSESGDSDPTGRKTLLDFLRVICLCHDVTKVTDAKGKVFMTGPSQDELCLIDMAAKTGLCEFIDRNSSVFTIKVLGQVE